ncbi:hypothetical protein [Pseudomonas putida]|uniref:Uncharacterized protein n=1 Tax=Pseudomonas putida TaxID=303 RepID=A0A8I1EHV8_PSEPU|nr:hypothetical protein [Pseudomonas putida]MBI6885806.1 hypothetical protein [Pseudomonas putida]
MEERLADSMIKSTASKGRIAGHLLTGPAVGKTGGKPIAKAKRKAQRAARRKSRT